GHPGKRGEEDDGLVGDGGEVDDGFRGDAKGSLGADEQAHEVGVGTVAVFAADSHDFPFRGHHVEAEDVVYGHAVLGAVDAAGVFRDVAAYGAGRLAGGVRGIEQVVGAGITVEPGVDHAGFHGGGAVFG